VDDWRINGNEPPEVALHHEDPLSEWTPITATQEPIGVLLYEPSELPQPAGLIGGKRRAYLHY
jgi:hypothetical protein